MNITTREEGAVTIVALHGKVMNENDLTELKETAKNSMLLGRNRILIDFSDVDWINSSGLGALIMIRGLLLEVGGQLRLAGLNHTVREVMNINRLDKVFDISPTVDEALADTK